MRAGGTATSYYQQTSDAGPAETSPRTTVGCGHYRHQWRWIQCYSQYYTSTDQHWSCAESPFRPGLPLAPDRLLEQHRMG